MKWSQLTSVILIAMICVLMYDKWVAHKPKTDIDFHQLELETVNGEQVSTNELAGKPLFITFWASWCKPCLREMPSIAALYNDFKDKDIAFLMISVEEAAEVKQYQETHSTHLPLYVLQSSGTIPIHSIPLTYLINADGQVETVVNRAKNWNSSHSRKQVERLLHANEKETSL